MYVFLIVADCGEIEEIANGSTDLVFNSTTYQSIVIYNCSVGYNLIGPSERSCLSSGYWNETDPFCIGKYSKC